MKRHVVESLEPRVLLAADWQNAFQPLDVNASDGSDAITPLDVLVVINELNDPQYSHVESGALGARGSDDLPYVDVDGNNHVSPLDALMVINHINEQVVEADPIGTVDVPQAADAFIAGSPRAAASGGGTLENDTLVNSTVDRRQSEPDVAGSAGGIMVVWQSEGQDGSSLGIFGQRYSADGARVGDEFQVNTTTRGSQRSPKVAVDAQGNSMVVWQSLGQDGSGWGIYGQAYDANGNPVGGEVQINDYTRGAQMRPNVEALANGNFVVAWEGKGSGDGFGVYMKEYSGTTVVTPQTQVNITESGNQARPTITAFPDGDFAVAWQGKGPGDNSGVFMRQFGSNDTGEIRVNEIGTKGLQSYVSISAGSNGDLVAAWQDGADVIVQHYVNGVRGDRLRANITDSGLQVQPVVSMLQDGSFVVTWWGKGPGDPKGTFSRTFTVDSVGTVTGGDEVRVNMSTRAKQIRPGTAAVNGGYVATWQGTASADRKGVFVRFFDTQVQGPFALNAIPDQTVNEGDTVSATASVEDLDGVADTPVFSLSGPDGATIDPDTGVITWLTDESDGPGTFDFIVTATAGDFSDSDSFIVTVNEVNQAPVIGSINDRVAPVGAAFTETVPTPTDADLPAQTLTMTAAQADGSALPAWLSFDPTTGVFSGTPGEADAGAVDVVVTVSDGVDTATSGFQINVSLGGPPAVSSPVADQTVEEGSALPAIDASSVFVDPDGDVLTLSATLVDGSPLPSWLTFADEMFTGTPGGADVGVINVRLTASDGINTGSDDFTITVTEVPNQAPVATDIADQVLNEDQAFNLGTAGNFSDPDGDALTLSATLTDGSALPAWLSFDAGNFTGTPDNADVGVINVRVSASDGEASVSDDFSITVVDVNEAPIVSPGAFVIPAASANGFAVGDVLFSDPDPGDSLSFTATGGDDSIFGIDSSGAITVIDSTQAVPGSYALNVQVTDDDGATDTATIDILVSDAGVPQIAAYSLVALDGDGNEVTSLQPGDTFDLVLRAQDISAAPFGVFSAYADVNYPSELVTVAGDVTHSDMYENSTNADVGTAGIVDEAGGFDGSNEVGAQIMDVITIPMQVSSSATIGSTLNFTTDPVENQVLRGTLVFRRNDVLATSEVSYGTLSIPIGETTEVTATGGGNDSGGVISSPLMAPAAISLKDTTQPVNEPADERPVVNVPAVAVAFDDVAVTRASDQGTDWWNESTDAEEDSETDAMWNELTLQFGE